MERRQRGIIKIWKDEKGFGFIAPVDGGPDLFFHANDVMNSRRRDLEGHRVTYVLVPGRDGKPAATDVRLAVAEVEAAPQRQERPDRFDRPARRRKSRGGRILAWAVSLLFLGAVTVFSLQYFTLYVPAAYVAMCGVTYLTYRHDKYCALMGYRRVPEGRLHLMELLGGWPGALVAQRTIGHKNRKGSYQVAFWFFVALHVAVVGFVAFHRFSNRDNPQALWNVGSSTESREPMTGNVTVEWSDNR